MASNAPLEMMADFIPTIESTSLHFDPTWEEFTRAADDVGAAKRPQCIFVPYDVSANAVVFNFLAASFKLWQIMLHPSCIAFYHCSACVHI
jgi:hypothetical protein